MLVKCAFKQDVDANDFVRILHAANEWAKRYFSKYFTSHIHMMQRVLRIFKFWVETQGVGGS